MAGIVDNGDVGIPHRVRKIAQRATHFVRLEVSLQFDDVKSGTLEGGGYGSGVVGGIDKLGYVLIGGIPDDQRYAFFSESGAIQAKNRKKDEYGCPTTVHRNSTYLNQRTLAFIPGITITAL